MKRFKKILLLIGILLSIGITSYAQEDEPGDFYFNPLSGRMDYVSDSVSFGIGNKQSLHNDTIKIPMITFVSEDTLQVDSNLIVIGELSVYGDGSSQMTLVNDTLLVIHDDTLFIIYRNDTIFLKSSTGNLYIDGLILDKNLTLGDSVIIDSILNVTKTLYVGGDLYVPILQITDEIGFDGGNTVNEIDATGDTLATNEGTRVIVGDTADALRSEFGLISASAEISDSIDYAIRTSPVNYGIPYYYSDKLVYNSLFIYDNFKFNNNQATGYGYRSLYNLIDQGESAANTAIGYYSMYNCNNGYQNTAIGEMSSYTQTSGSNNTSLGYRALYTNSTATGNTAIGSQSLYTSIGNYNTSVGLSSLYANTTGIQNIAIGYVSGKNVTTLSNRLYINSLNRTNILGDTTLSIIYGYQDATISNQRLYFNSNVYISNDVNISGKLVVEDSLRVDGPLTADLINNNSYHLYAGFDDSTTTIECTQNVWAHLSNSGDSLFRYTEADDWIVYDDTITIPATGDYEIYFNISFSGNNGETWNIRTAKMSGATETTVGFKSVRYTSNNDTGNVSNNVYGEFTAGDKLYFQVMNVTDDDDALVKSSSVLIKYLHN